MSLARLLLPATRLAQAAGAPRQRLLLHWAFLCQPTETAAATAAVATAILVLALLAAQQRRYRHPQRCRGALALAVMGFLALPLLLQLVDLSDLLLSSSRVVVPVRLLYRRRRMATPAVAEAHTLSAMTMTMSTRMTSSSRHRCMAVHLPSQHLLHLDPTSQPVPTPCQGRSPATPTRMRARTLV